MRNILFTLSKKITGLFPIVLVLLFSITPSVYAGALSSCSTPELFDKATSQKCTEMYNCYTQDGALDPGEEIEYNWFCKNVPTGSGGGATFRGTTGDLPTGSLTRPTENQTKYDSGIVPTDEAGNVLSLVDLIIRLTNFALGFVGTFAIVAFIYGGYLMVANFGNDDLTGKGKKILTYSAIGIVIILISFTAVNALLGAASTQSDQVSPNNTLVPQEEGVARDFVEATVATLRNDALSLFSSLRNIGDMCPGTPLGRNVSLNGCAANEFPADTDGDGVSNHFDLDDDNDGVLDANDADDDGDGVDDVSDFCPNTLLFNLARPYDFSPYRELIRDGKISRDNVQYGHAKDDGANIPLLLPYVLGNSQNVSDTLSTSDLRRPGCALYETSQDTDGDGYPNGNEDTSCTQSDVHINGIDCDDDNDGILDADDADDDNDGVPDVPVIPVAFTVGGGGGGGAQVSRSPGRTVVTRPEWTAFRGDTVVLDMRELYDNGPDNNDPIDSPQNYVWIQDSDDDNTIQLRSGDTAHVVTFIPQQIGTYTFRLHDRSDLQFQNPISAVVFDGADPVVTVNVIGNPASVAGPTAQVGGGGRQAATNVIQSGDWSAYSGDTLILDLRVLFPNLQWVLAQADFVFPGVSRAFAQGLNPYNVIWVQYPDDPIKATLRPGASAFETSFVPRVAGVYRFRLFDRSDLTTPLTSTLFTQENGTVLRVEVLATDTGGGVIVTPDIQVAELFDQFRRTILLTCRRLPQTFSVTQLCTADGTKGTLIVALRDFQKNPTETQMATLLAEVDKLNELIRSLPKVVARLQATPSKGSAPLSVSFDASQSQDPFEIGIPNENYRWCVGYTTLDQAFQCSTIDPKTGPWLYTGPFAAHTFETPGIYNIQLQVSTAQTVGGLAAGAQFGGGVADDNEKAAMDGYATIRIVVEPPKANIRLTGEVAGRKIDLTRENQIKAIVSQARNGITFDAGGTTDYSDTTAHILSTRWDFGDGVTLQEDRFVPIQIHAYTTPGTYGFIFEVQDDRGNTSRKVLDVIITDIVAELTVAPTNAQGDLTTQFTFDASGSRLEGGSITGYDWEIYPIINNARGIPVATSSTNPNLRGSVVNFTFPAIGEYDVKVLVLGDNGQADNTFRRVQILSRAPVARFTWRVSDQRKPATVFFDASSSSDPDPNTDLSYTWFFDDTEGDLTGNDKVPQQGYYTFATSGQHKVELLITDRPDGTGVSHRTKDIVRINSTLDVDFTANSFSARPDDTIKFTAISANALGYFWNFGDGVKEYAPGASVDHSFKQSGTYNVSLTVDNEKGEENTVSKRVRIGQKDMPIAIGRVMLNGNEVEPDERVCGSGEGILVDRLSTVTFDGSPSVNRDGTTLGLRYEWNFDDGQKSNSRSAVHKFDELTVGSDCYNVALTVSDRATNQFDTTPGIGIRVENVLPTATGIDIIQPTQNVTPVTVPISLVGIKDPDGRIIDYTWWYYDVNEPNNKIDVHVTPDAKTAFTIGPRAKEGVESTYYFAVEIKDNDNGKILGENIFGRSAPLKITNGSGVIARSQFTVNKSRPKVGEEILFTSTTKDPLGRFIPSSNYKWDFYGNGRYERDIVGAQVKFRYDKPGTYRPKLKVITDGVADIGELEIIVEPITLKPEAAFLFVKSGNKITFINNSSVDPQLDIKTLQYAWDFDTEVDSDGNGIKNDDVDSAQVNPTNIYDFAGDREIKVKLKITDEMGLTDEVYRVVITPKTQEIGALGAAVQSKLQAVLRTDPPADDLDKKVYLKQTEGVVKFIMKESTGKIKEYHLDVNVRVDSDNDGIPDNDIDNSLHASLDNGEIFEYTYPADAGNNIRARLTVSDFQSGSSSANVDIVLNDSGLSPFESSFHPDEIFLNPGLFPVVQFSIADDVIVPNKEITFDASSTKFPEEGVKEYQWDFDGNDIFDETVTDSLTKHTFSVAGEYDVRLGVFSESNLYGEYSETVIVRDLYSAPSANFDFALNDKEATFKDLSSFDESQSGNNLSYSWEFVSLDAQDNVVDGDENIVTTEITPSSDGVIADAVVLSSDGVRVSFASATRLMDSNDQPYIKSVSVPKIITAPKGTLNVSKKIVDAFLVGSVKPLFVSQNAIITIDARMYSDLKIPEVYLYTFPDKIWEPVSTHKDGDMIVATMDHIGIFALVDDADTEIAKTDFTVQKTVDVSTGQNPVKTFDEYGTYRVTLTVTDASGRKNSVVKLVVVSAGVVKPFESEADIDALPVETLIEPVVTQPQSEAVTQETLIAQEEFLEQGTAVTTQLEIVPEEKKSGGGISILMIVIGISLFIIVIVFVFFIIHKIREQLAQHEGVMAGNVQPVTPPIEIVEPPLPPPSNTTPSGTPPVVSSEDNTSEGGAGPIPEWLKKK